MGQVRTGVDLDASLGYLLKQAASTLRSSMDAALRPLGLTVPQYACLELLAQRPGLSNSELARGAFVTRQSMNVLLQGLERDGFVSRPAEPPALVRPSDEVAASRDAVYASGLVSFEARNADAAASPAAKLFSASQPPSTVSAIPFT